MGDRTPTWHAYREEGNIAEARSGDGGSLQRRRGRNLTHGTPGAGSWAVTGEKDQQHCAVSLRSRHRNQDQLGRWTVWNPRI
jgi:hypothetical protein